MGPVFDLDFKRRVNLSDLIEEPAMGGFVQKILRYSDRLGTQEWALLLVGVIVIGYFCLRGFGSRSGY